MIYIQNIFDEVYQAALAAGSGGIRWNSMTNYIELSDENKNWVNWRYYNPNKIIFQKYFLRNPQSTNINHSLTNIEQGLYIVCIGNYSVSSANVQITTTGSVRYNESFGYSRFAIIYSEGGDNINCYVSSLSSRYPTLSVYQIQGAQNVSSLSIKPLPEGGTNTEQISDISVGNFIFGFFGSGNNPSSYSINIGDGEMDTYVNTGHVALCGYIYSGSGSLTINTNGGGVNGLTGICLLS